MSKVFKLKKYCLDPKKCLSKRHKFSFGNP